MLNPDYQYTWRIARKFDEIGGQNKVGEARIEGAERPLKLRAKPDSKSKPEILAGEGSIRGGSVMPLPILIFE